MEGYISGAPIVHIYLLARKSSLKQRASPSYEKREQKSFEDIACLGESPGLSEVTLDGNPFSQDGAYKQTILRHLQHLRQLDMKRVTDDERRIASVMARKEEEKKRETSKMVVMKEKRRTAINNARKQWEVMQGSMMVRAPNNLVATSKPVLYANHVSTVPNSQIFDTPRPLPSDERETSSAQESGRQSRPSSAKSSMSECMTSTSARQIVRPPSRVSSANARRPPTPDKMSVRSAGSGSGITVESNGSTINMDYLADLEGDTLTLYGQGSLEDLDKPYGVQAAGAVNIVCFKFIEFDDIAKHLHKIRARFPSVHTLVFNSTNIHSLNQMNALASIRRLDNLVIETEGNPITQYSLWRTFALFRLAHFCLKKINGTEVSASDIVNAEKFFGTLSHMTTTELPQSRLLSLLGESKKKQLVSLLDDKSRRTPDSSKTVDRAGLESMGRAGLVYIAPDTFKSKFQEHQKRRSSARSYIRQLTQDAVSIDQKKTNLSREWPRVFREMVHTSVAEMWDAHAYMKVCADQHEKS